MDELKKIYRKDQSKKKRDTKIRLCICHKNVKGVQDV